METTRQQKIAKQIQKDVAEIFQKEGEGIVRGSLVTVTLRFTSASSPSGVAPH